MHMPLFRSSYKIIYSVLSTDNSDTLQIANLFSKNKF